MDVLNRLMVIILEQAELRAKERKELTLDYCHNNVDRLLAFNERSILEGAISAEPAREIANERYDEFDVQRWRDEALEADADDFRELDALEKQIKKDGDK